MTLVGNHDLGLRITIWRWHVRTDLFAGEPKLVSSQVLRRRGRGKRNKEFRLKHPSTSPTLAPSPHGRAAVGFISPGPPLCLFGATRTGLGVSVGNRFPPGLTRRVGLVHGEPATKTLFGCLLPFCHFWQWPRVVIVPRPGDPDDKIARSHVSRRALPLPQTTMKHYPGSELTVPQLIHALKLKLRRTVEHDTYASVFFFSLTVRLMETVQG